MSQPAPANTPAPSTPAAPATPATLDLDAFARVCTMASQIGTLLSTKTGQQLGQKLAGMLNNHVETAFPAQAAVVNAATLAARKQRAAQMAAKNQQFYHNMWLAIFVKTAQHAPGADETAYLNTISSQLPVGGCRCQPNFDAYRKANPPDYSTAEALFVWWVNLKNKINVDLGKPVITVAQAHAVWDPLVQAALAAPAPGKAT